MGLWENVSIAFSNGKWVLDLYSSQLSPELLLTITRAGENPGALCNPIYFKHRMIKGENKKLALRPSGVPSCPRCVCYEAPAPGSLRQTLHIATLTQIPGEGDTVTQIAETGGTQDSGYPGAAADHQGWPLSPLTGCRITNVPCTSRYDCHIVVITRRLETQPRTRLKHLRPNHLQITLSK